MFSRVSKFEKLRDLVHLSKTAESLDDLPDRLEKVVESFNSSQLHPQFRTDIYEILNSAASLAEALADTSYDARSAVKIATGCMAVIGRVIVHLECERPAFTGWGILFTSSRSLYPASFNTEEEAYKVLDHLGGSAAEVIPIRITSDFAVRPTLPLAPHIDHADTALSVEAEEDPIPPAVLPPSSKTFGGPVGEEFVKQFNAAKAQTKYQIVPEK